MEIVTVGIGQFGVNANLQFWECMLMEYGIDKEGRQPVSPQTPVHADTSRHFRETSTGIFLPRAVMIDCDSQTIDAIATSSMKRVFDERYCFLSGIESAAGLFPLGYQKGQRLLRKSSTFRKQVESCDQIYATTKIAAMEGGSGSGVCKAFVEHMQENATIRNAKDLTHALYPAPFISTSINSPYNVVLGVPSILETDDFSVIYDNEALYEKFYSVMDPDAFNPSYNDLNTLVAQMIGKAQTFSNSCTLAPFPRLNQVLPAYAPYASNYMCSRLKPTIKTITLDLIKPSASLSSAVPIEGCFLSAHLVYQGTKCPFGERLKAIETILSSYNIEFAAWSPTNFKTYHYGKDVSFPEKGFLKAPELVVGGFFNSTCVEKTLSKALSLFDHLRASKSFMHWYGTEEEEFDEAVEIIRDVVQTYKMTKLDA